MNHRQRGYIPTFARYSDEWSGDAGYRGGFAYVPSPRKRTVIWLAGLIAAFAIGAVLYLWSN